jgi:6-phospho-3-hexuloisomerase
MSELTTEQLSHDLHHHWQTIIAENQRLAEQVDLGLTVFVVGETTTPAIKAGDLLLAGSGSGTTSTIVKAAEKAKAAGAQVVAISTTTDSPLAALATQVVVLPAAQKQDHGGSISQQYAGSLFEQSVLLLTDAIFQTLWALDGTPAEELWKRHANLE